MYTDKLPLGFDDPASPEREEEAALALWLDEASPEAALEVLVNRYAEKAYRLAYLTLAGSLEVLASHPPTPETALQAAARGLARAASRRSQAANKTNVQMWVLSQVLKESKRASRLPIPPLQKNDAAGLLPFPQIPAPKQAVPASRLPELALCYGANLPQYALAEGLGQNKARSLQSMHWMGAEVREAWNAIPFLPRALPVIHEKASAILSQGRGGGFSLPELPLGKLGSLVFMIAVAAGLAYYLFMQDIPAFQPLFSQPGLAEIDPVERDALKIQSVIWRLDYPTASMPFQSADGRWLVYSTSGPVLTAEGEEVQSQLFVLDRQTGSYETLATQDGTLINSSSAEPSISADGRWVVFAAEPSQLLPEVSMDCDPRLNGPCYQVFLYDRETRSVTLVSKNSEGLPGEGSNRRPTITADGRYVVFFGTGELLVDDAPEKPCPSSADIWECQAFYLYDRLNDSLKLIMPPSGFVVNRFLQKAAITGDGRWIALSVSDGAYAPWSLQVMVYDRLFETFTLASASPDGTPANGSSGYQKISGDGRWVAFVSTGNNLGPQDENKSYDVYLLDRVTGRFTLVSRTPQGAAGNQGSGLGAWGNSGFDISPNGEYLVFLTYATNLAPDPDTVPEACQQLASITCQRLVRYHIPSGTLEVVFAYQHDDREYNNLLVSNTGEIILNEYIWDCQFPQNCARIVLIEPGSAKKWMLEDQIKPYEDVLPNWKLLQTLQVDQTRVMTLAFSPSSALLAGGLGNTNIKLWNTIAGYLRFELKGHTDAVTSLAFSPDGQLLFSGSLDKTIRVWNPSEGTEVTTIPVNTARVYSLAISPDGKDLAVGLEGSVYIYRERKGEYYLAHVMRFPGLKISSMVYSPDGSLLAVAPQDKTVWLVDAKKFNPVLRLDVGQPQVKSLDFNPAGDRLAVATETRIVQLWQVNTTSHTPSAEYVTGLEHFDRAWSALFVREGAALATLGWDGIIHLWDAQDGHYLETTWDSQPITSAAYDAYAQTLAAGLISPVEIVLLQAK